MKNIKWNLRVFCMRIILLNYKIIKSETRRIFEGYLFALMLTDRACILDYRLL